MFGIAPPARRLLHFCPLLQEQYAYSDAERDEILVRFRGEGDGKSIHIQRYEGPGEMNPDQL